MTRRRDGVASRLRQWARRIERDVTALYLAANDPRVPWYAFRLAGRRKELVVSPGAGHVGCTDRAGLIPFEKLSAFSRPTSSRSRGTRRPSPSVQLPEEEVL